MDAATRASYEAALKGAETELASHAARGEALQRAVDSLKALLGTAAAPAAPKPQPKPRKKAVNGRRARQVKVGTKNLRIHPSQFSGLGPTAAYRKFVRQYGAEYPVPSIANALIAGDVKSASRGSLMTGLHSVRRRDANAAEAKAKVADQATEQAKPAAEDQSE